MKKPINRSGDKACVECAETIPALAKKCSKCGAYQNWRRHIPFGQSTLALVISLIALGGSFVVGGRTAIETISNYQKLGNTRIAVALTGLDISKATLFISNPTPRNIVIQDIQCGLYIPIDPEKIMRDEQVDLYKDFMLDGSEAIGLFLASYRIKENTVLPPDGHLLIEGEGSHITRPLETEPSSSSQLEGKVGSYCYVSGIDEHNQLSVGAVVLPIENTVHLDVTGFLKKADFAPVQEPIRTELLAKVRAIRTANEKARATARSSAP